MSAASDVALRDSRVDSSHSQRRLFLLPAYTLWANETTLCAASSYLATLLASGRLESKTQSRVSFEDKFSQALQSPAYLDSDEESDKIVAISHKLSYEELALASFKRVDITDSSYTTFLGVLSWIGTGYITFAAFKSTNRYATASSPEWTTQSSRRRKRTSLRAPVSLPVPVSPKSVFRLADLLDLPVLAKLALENFKSQLTARNVAYETYTDVSETHTQLRDIALTFAVEHWKEVVDSEAYKELKNKAASGTEIHGYIGLLISEALMRRWAQ